MRILFALVALALGCLFAGPALAASASTGPAKLDQPLELALDTLDGKRFDLAQQRGRWVVVNYWATWCSPCIKEIPDLSAFDTSRDDVTVIGLAFEEIELDDLRGFLAKHPAAYPIALVDVYNPPKAFDVPRGLPTTYLVGRDGRLAERFIGPVTSAQLSAAIERHGAKP